MKKFFNKVGIVAALIGLLGAVIIAASNVIAGTKPVEMIIAATQTAEAKLASTRTFNTTTPVPQSTQRDTKSDWDFASFSDFNEAAMKSIKSSDFKLLGDLLYHQIQNQTCVSTVCSSNPLEKANALLMLESYLSPLSTKYDFSTLGFQILERDISSFPLKSVQADHTLAVIPLDGNWRLYLGSDFLSDRYYISDVYFKPEK